MKTAQEVLIDFMMYKVYTLYKVTRDPICFDFITSVDVLELKDWNVWNSEEIIRIIKRNFEQFQEGKECTDGDICPWCIDPDNEDGTLCRHCGWGARHGMCHTPDSLYIRFCARNGSILRILSKDPEFIEKAQKILG